MIIHEKCGQNIYCSVDDIFLGDNIAGKVQRKNLLYCDDCKEEIIIPLDN